MSTAHTLYAQTIPSQPDAPMRVTSAETNATHASIDLKWNPVLDTGGVPLTGYKVFHGASTLAYDGSTAPQVTTASITALTIDQDYEFYVIALNPQESIASSKTKLRAAALPSTPGAITEIAASRTAHQLELQWPAVTATGGSAITAYTLMEVYYDNVSGILKEKVVYFGTAVQSLVTGLSAGHQYQFKVKCTNMVGDSAFSSSYSFTMVDKPTAPLNVKVVTDDALHAYLTWEVPISNGGQAITSYKVYRKLLEDPITNPSLLVTKAHTDYFHNDTTIVAGKKYHYYLTASNTVGGESEMSTSALAWTIQAPAGMTKPVKMEKSMNEITVQWAAPTSTGSSPTLQYILYMRPSYEKDYSEIFRGLAKSFTATHLKEGFSYYFKVQSNNAIGESEISPASDAIWTVLPPSSPMNVKLVSRTSTDIKIRWEVPNSNGGFSLSGYKIHQAIDSGAYTEVTTAPSKTNSAVTTYEISSATPDKMYSIKI